MSSMMDLAGALGGGGPPPGLGAAGPGGGPPIDLGAGPGGPPVDLGAPPPEPPPDDTGGGEQYASSLDALDGAEEALHSFIKLDPDEADRAIAAQCLQNVLKLKAGNQKAQQGGEMKGLARALQQGGGY